MLDSLLTKRSLLVTGKGGVGKTTLVAALARLAAARGKRVLVCEVATCGDDESPLAALFGLKRFPRDTVSVLPNVWAAILLAQVGQERFLADKVKSARLAKAALASRTLQKLLATAPSAREMGILYHLLSEFRKRDPLGNAFYDFIIIDMPATGHALSITSLPNILLDLFGPGAIADTLKEGQACFCDSSVTAALVVSLPEPLAVQEALELIAGLGKDDVTVGATVVNQITKSPVTPREREALIEQLQHQPLLGRHSLSRSAMGDAAIARLLKETSVPMVELPYYAFGDVVSQMVGSLEQAT